MDVSVVQRDDVTVLRVAGSVDALTAGSLTAAFQREVGAGRVRLVADLSAVDYTSSAGLRALLGALKEARTGGGDLRLAGPQQGVSKVLQLSGFTSILKVFGSVDDAVKSYGA